MEDIKDAEIIVMQSNDYFEIMFFNDDTSQTAIKKNINIWNYINTNFAQDTVIGDVFTNFKRKQIK